ncbi:S-layer_homology domain-containing protein [Hexamita inflata]|uniref:S-layer homology domain-containing protein n=1 Tax=Hexamita inflata TaxID=28002 RepID=A0AA86QAX4_9EUKA|nr:S-layer homology domain-containing protein [Hexamita inflata]
MIHLCVAICITPDQNKDVTLILQNKQESLTENYYNSINNPGASTYRQNKASTFLNSLIKTVDRTYLWDSYKNIEQGTQLMATVSNIYFIALAYATTPNDKFPNIHYQNTTTLDILSAALDHILSNYYKADTVIAKPLSGSGNQNWWEWQIGIPDILNNIIILTLNNISQNIINKYLASSKRFQPNADTITNLFNINEKLIPSTGGNLVDTSRICFLRGLISQNLTESDLAFFALDRIFDFVTISDGFYKDYSFIQHNTIVASTSYGQMLFSGLTNLITILNGSTMYNYRISSLKNIFSFIINAAAPFMYHAQMMNMVNGRSISRKEQEYANCKEFIGYMAVLSQFAPSSEVQTALQSIVKHHLTKAKPFQDFSSIYQQARVIILQIMNNTSIPATLPEFLHKRFSSMARVVHRRENYAFAIAMHSYKVGDYESINGENLHGWYTGDGMEYMYSNYQQQYIDFFPTVDPYLLQGTTELTVRRNDSAVDGVRSQTMSKATFVGGTDLNGTGVVGMEFYNFNYKLSGFRSWFLFDQSVMIVANYNSTENYRSTFLNRELGSLAQNVFVDGQAVSNDLKAYNCSRLFVEGTGVNDSVGYIFLKQTEIYLKKELRVGDWNQIGIYSGAAQRNYVTGYVEKTNAPLQLQYVIVFWSNKTQFDLINQFDYQVIAQNSSMHVVRHVENNVTYDAANIFNLSAGQSVNVSGFQIFSNSSILIKTAGKVQISISDPTQKQSVVNFTYYDKPLQVVNVSTQAGASQIFEFNLNNDNTQRPNANQMLDISQILLNKQNALTENIYSKISYKQAITIRQNKATQLINEMNTTNERTYLWSSQPLLQQGPQLLETVKNIQVIATAYAVTPFENYTNLHYKNLTTLNIVQSALDFILQNYYKADLIKLSPPVSGKVQNWWEWQIAIPDVLNNIVVLIKDDISQNILNSFLASSKRFLPSPTICGNLSGSSCPQALVSTGGNLVNTAQIGFIRGLLSQNITESDISFHALDHIFDFVSESDGFYKDYSFIQHYSIPSSANYGQVVFFGLTNLIVILNESTMYNYSQSSISKIFDFIINGETTLIYNCQMMNMVNGRSISLLEQEYINCKFVISYVAVLSQYTQSSEQSEYMKRIVKHHITKAQPLIDITLLYQQAGIIMTKIRANTSIPATLPEFLHKRFSSMARVVHRRENYAFAIAMHSYKVGDYESINGENLHGWYTGDGMEYMYSNYQQQYIDFFPTVDPYLLQGTTELTVRRNDSAVDGVRSQTMSKATFVGGTDLNGTGVVGMEFYNFNYKLSGFRSWFLFDQSVMIVANYNSTENYRSTFLNRELGSLAQNVFVDGQAVSNDLKAYNCSRLFVEGTGVNDSVGYIFLKQTEIYLKKELRVGDWNQIGIYSGAAQRNYVTGYVEKTNAPLQLQYVIVFGSNKTQFDLINQFDYQVIAQNSSMHVVRHVENNATYDAANIFNLSAGQSVNVSGFQIFSNSSILIKTAGKVQISISDPTQKQSVVNFTYYDKPLQVVNVSTQAGASQIFEFNLNNDNTQRPNANQMLDISQILLNKQNALTENIYSKISYKQAITIRQNKATQLINEMNTTNERTYLWSSQPLLQQGPQLLETVKNIQVIATAYAVTPFENYTNLHYKNLTTLNIVQSALDFILQNYYKADLIKLSPPVSGKVQNWWEWQIAIPDVLNNIVVLIKDDISQNILNSFLASSKRFLPSPTICGNLSGSSCPQALVSTGGNLVNTAQIGFIRGLLSQNITESDISFHALDHIFDFVSESDGFYKDYSFIQHYSIPSSANYGQVVFFGLTNLIVILNESTMYNYSQSSISKIFDFIINGETTLIYNCQMMNMVNGRSISLLEQEYINCKFVISYVAVLSQYTQSSEQSEYMKRIVKHHITKAQPLIDITLLYQQAGIIMTKIRANTSIPATLPEFLHKRFSSMARVVHRRENYAFAIAMHSYKVGDYESINGENLHGWYTGDGMEYMYSNYQQQYIDFFPTVDPYLLQGTTELTVRRNDSAVDGVRSQTMSKATFVGGTDLNGTGVVGMEFYNFNYKLSGFRSWFLFDQSVMIVANYNSTENYRSTFLNRELGSLAQNVFVDGQAVSNDLKAYNCSRLFVEGTGVNDSVGYIFLKQTEIYLKKELRVGDWNQIGIYSGAAQRNYVTGYVEKTNAPLQLQYVIVFGSNKTQFDLINQFDYQVIAQNSSMHVVRHVENNATYDAANIFNLSAGQNVNISGFQIFSNSSVLIRTEQISKELNSPVNKQNVSGNDFLLNKMGKVQISISDPTQKQTLLNYFYDQNEQKVNVTGAQGSSFVFEHIITVQTEVNKCGTACLAGISGGIVVIIAAVVVGMIILYRRKRTAKRHIKKKVTKRVYTAIFI